ncbi:hypothetical protein, conserved in T. vivax [Trypanosoma vivax Y486]|uniref:Uncharacterized protein n=1 Tax=Trypanosoma vivax (strain Y486) TaxID=1055687 RepID=F9WU09_TRYVY|nr:hypothetical protein, conserved in T. vivax [Trypanosoma vivax Y486]|eukprot:CCD21055.1 hypothetical protein, conserved in T. vivax [Trypanosoma vivax Y486]
METMTASMMNFLERNGAELCDMLRQREALWTKLNETKQRLKGVSQGASTTLVSTAKIKGATADTDELVRDALKEVEGLSKFSVFSASTESLSSRSVTLAREAMENAMKASEQAAKLSDRTKSRFAFVDEEVESEYEKLKGLENNLRKLSKEAHIDISGGNTNECNGKLVNKLETSTKDLLRSAAKLNTSKLLEANRTLGRLAELVVQINTNVDSISTDVELASRKLKSAREFGHSATMAAESAVTEALEQLMNKLCATAAELRVLRSNWALLSATATNIKKRVSEEEAHAIAVLKTVRGSSDMSPYVEEGFTVAVRMATLLDRELQRSNAQFGKVTADYTAGKLVGVRADNTVCFDAVRNAVAKVFAGIYERLHKDACGKNATIELVQKLKAESGGLSLLRNATAITKLSHFAMKMSDELAGAVKRMSTAAVRAAEANEALAEAVRRAREESAGLRCSPLYRQLLNALGGMW